jgi:resuscitation-promoting factor RpfB
VIPARPNVPRPAGAGVYPCRMSPSPAAVESGPQGRPHRRPLTSLVLSAILLPLLGFPPSVMLDVDGRTTITRARVATVGEAVALAGVELSPGDAVVPAPSTPVTDGLDVSVASAVDVLLVLDGRRIRVRTPDATVGGVLLASGTVPRLTPEASITPAWGTTLTDGDVIEVTNAWPVSVVDREGFRSVWTTAHTVDELLRELGVEVTWLDRIAPQRDTVIDGPLTVTIARVELVEEQVESTLAFALERVLDPSLMRGIVRVIQSGREGLVLETVVVTLVDGVEESRLVTDRTVLVEPLSRIERVGTRTNVDDTIWDAMARCESGGRWDIVRRVSADLSYYGGLQFHPRTWTSYRPADFPQFANEATREQQILVAERVLARQGWGAWPSCASRLGLR